MVGNHRYPCKLWTCKAIGRWLPFVFKLPVTTGSRTSGMLMSLLVPTICETMTMNESVCAMVHCIVPSHQIQFGISDGFQKFIWPERSAETVACPRPTLIGQCLFLPAFWRVWLGHNDILSQIHLRLSEICLSKVSTNLNVTKSRHRTWDLRSLKIDADFIPTLQNSRCLGFAEAWGWKIGHPKGALGMKMWKEREKKKKKEKKERNWSFCDLSFASARPACSLLSKLVIWTFWFPHCDARHLSSGLQSDLSGPSSNLSRPSFFFKAMENSWWANNNKPTFVHHFFHCVSFENGFVWWGTWLPNSSQRWFLQCNRILWWWRVHH